MNTTTIKNDYALLGLRVMLGSVFLFHGAQKLFGWFAGPGIEGMTGFNESLGIPLPYISAWLAALTEFAGGVLLIAGNGYRVFATPLVFTMLVASFAAHGAAFDAQKGGMEYPLTLAITLAALAVIGTGNLTAARLAKAIHLNEPVRMSTLA